MSCMVANKPRFLLTKQGSRKVLGPAHVDRIVDKFIEESEPVVARRVRKVVAHTHTHCKSIDLRCDIGFITFLRMIMCVYCLWIGPGVLEERRVLLCILRILTAVWMPVNSYTGCGAS